MLIILTLKRLKQKTGHSVRDIRSLPGKRNEKTKVDLKWQTPDTMENFVIKLCAINK